MSNGNLQRYAALFGRIFLAAIFVGSGLNKIGGWDQTAAYMAAKGMPLVPMFLAATIAIEVLGGLSVILGFRARIGALALAMFLVPVTIVFHNPMGLEGMAKQMEMINALKNLSIIGGLLVVAAFGAGPISLDARRRQ